MKSRFSLRTSSALQPDTTAIGRPLAARVGKVSLARRFELKHNTSPRFARRRQERRQGQALLLAVLIMLLAALLSAGFLAVVSGNLNQTARIADKTKAIEASRAGITYANAQLSGSSQGDLWRPINVSPAPAPGTTAHNFYYSQLEKVQGWANTLVPPDPGDNFPNATYNVPNYFEAYKVYSDATYGKFPDPQAPTTGDAPKFLVKVQEIPSNLPLGNSEYEHRGEIKITSIGLSDDDPNVFHKSVAYKNGRQKSPWSVALRSVSNWNFGDKDSPAGVPFGVVNAPAAQTATPSTPVTGAAAIVNVDARLNDENAPLFAPTPGNNPPTAQFNVPFNVVIINKNTNQVRGAVVTAVTITAATQTAPAKAELTMAKLEAPVEPGEIVQKAAAIGTASTIDLLNVSTITTGTYATEFGLARQPQPSGILANGSVWLQNQVKLSGLGKDNQKLFASGSFAIENTLNSSANATELLEGGDVGPINTGDPDSNLLVSSNSTLPQPVFPGKIQLTADALLNKVKISDFINDGWNTLGMNAKTLGLDYSNSRDVEPFKPAKIDNAENLARYRGLTRDSLNGIYVDNRADMERVGTAEMTQAQLMEMWTSDLTTSAQFRNGTPGAAGTSLEQQHLRGWIGPDEFLARGALVELTPSTAADLGPDAPNPFVRVTYDARSDAGLNPNPNGPDQAKAVRDPATGNTRPGVYTQELIWPANGTIFAEGNLRIRGQVNLATAPRNLPSLTVVSRGNIYIEGSVSVDPTGVNAKKLMLMAKKNVVVNPTRLVMGHVDEQTLSSNLINTPVTGVAPNQTVTIPVVDASRFVQGDVVETFDPAAPATVAVRGIVSAPIVANSLTLQVLEGTDIAVGSAVKTLLSNKYEFTAPNTTKVFTADDRNVIARRILLQGNAADFANMRLAIDHVAQSEATKSFNVNTAVADPESGANPVVYTKPNPLNVLLTNKRVEATGTFDKNDPLVRFGQKLVKGTSTAPNVKTDSFPTTAPAAEATALAYSLTNLEADMNATSNKDPATTPPQGWKYVTNKNTLATVPSFYLAAVGVRAKDYASLTDDPTRWVEDVGTTAYDIPLATSVRFQISGQDRNLVSTYFQDASNPAVDSEVKYIGFNPTYGVVDDIDSQEDALTVDRSFYQADAKNSTLDSRKASVPFASGQSFLLRLNNDNTAINTALAGGVTLPQYRVRSMKLENSDLNAATPVIKPADMQINAFVYAQEGSWFVIPGDYFRTGNPVRSNLAGDATYIDFNDNGTPDTGEYIDADTSGDLTTNDFADLNRNGVADPGELQAALRFVRYNYKINFFGAILENQTATGADVTTPGATPTDKPNLIQAGAMQDWTNKWAAYDSTAPGTTPRDKFNFINYVYDPAMAQGTLGTSLLRVPITDDLIYQQ